MKSNIIIRFIALWIVASLSYYAFSDVFASTAQFIAMIVYLVVLFSSYAYLLYLTRDYSRAKAPSAVRDRINEGLRRAREKRD